MIIYFTTNEKFYSKLLRWIFDEPTSHVGASFKPEGQIELVADCTKPHGKLMHLNNWLFKHRLLCSIEINMKKEHELQAYELVVNNCVMKPYDFPAYIYGFYWGLRIKFFGHKPPKKNAESSKEMDLCTEILNPIKGLLLEYAIDIYDMDLAAMTPTMLAMELYKQTIYNSRVDWKIYDASVILYLREHGL